MTRDQAQTMAQLIRERGSFTSVDVRQVGGEFARPDAPWEVEIWSVNAAAGNRNLTRVRDFAPQMAATYARQARGRASKRDRAALARMAAERQVNSD